MRRPWALWFALLVLLPALAAAQITTTPAPYVSGSGVTIGAVTFPTGTGLQAGTTAGNTLLLRVYDTDTGPAYVTAMTATSGTAPTVAWAYLTYLNFGATAGTSGYGLRDNSGTVQFKSAGGDWTDLTIAAGTGYFSRTGTELFTATDGDTLVLGSAGARSPIIPLGAGILAQRDSTTAQEWRTYYSYTNGSNYQYAALVPGAAAVTLSAQTAGSGADNIDIVLTPAGTGQVKVGTAAIGATVDSGAVDALRTGVTSLTDETATAVVTIAMADAAVTGGELAYLVVGIDAGADNDAYTGAVRFAAQRKGATVTCSIGTIGTDVVTKSHAGADLAVAATCDASSGTSIVIKLNANTALTTTTFKARWQLRMFGVHGAIS